MGVCCATQGSACSAPIGEKERASPRDLAAIAEVVKAIDSKSAGGMYELSSCAAKASERNDPRKIQMFPWCAYFGESTWQDSVENN